MFRRLSQRMWSAYDNSLLTDLVPAAPVPLLHILPSSLASLMTWWVAPGEGRGGEGVVPLHLCGAQRGGCCRAGVGLHSVPGPSPLDGTHGGRQPLLSGIST